MKRKQRPTQTKKTPRVRVSRGWEEVTLLGILGVSTLMILIALVASIGKTPAKRAEDELHRLAETYYVEYLYPRLLGDINVEPTEVLAEYQEKGVATTYLRQLLHYNQDENIEVAPVFKEVGCDTNATRVRYFPTEPYGPQDYTVEYFFRCEAEELTD